MLLVVFSLGLKIFPKLIAKVVPVPDVHDTGTYAK